MVSTITVGEDGKENENDYSYTNSRKSGHKPDLDRIRGIYGSDDPVHRRFRQLSDAA